MIGTIFGGKVEKIGGECIVTKYFIFGLLLIPIGTYYTTSASFNGISGFKILPHNSSILSGYVRYWLLACIMISVFWAYLEEQPGIYVLAIFLLVLFLLSIFRWGKLSKKEVSRRIVYKKYAGLYANPDDLPVDLKTTIFESLTAQWEEIKSPKEPWTLDPNPWTASHKTINTNLQHHYGLAYTMGKYAGATEKMDILWSLVIASMAHEFQEP